LAPHLVVGQNLIEEEKMAIGGVKLTIYSYYLKSIGLVMVAATLVLYLSFTGFSVGSSIWLSQW
jgi:ATP-binding cassette subfamily C (CFTR/MRP) protein 1